MRSIRMKVGLYEVFLSYIIYCLIFYFMSIITPFFYIFLASLSQEESGSRSIVQNYLSQKRKRIQINGGGQNF